MPFIFLNANLFLYNELSTLLTYFKEEKCNLLINIHFEKQTMIKTIILKKTNIKSFSLS